MTARAHAGLRYAARVGRWASFDWRSAVLVVLIATGSSSCGDDESAPPITCDAPPTPGEQPFVDATAALGIDQLHHFGDEYCELPDTVGGPGVCAFDYDDDGDVDLYFIDQAPHPNALWRNDGGAFTEVGADAGVDHEGDSVGCLAFDYDSDGDLDLYVTNTGPDRLFENDGGRFSDVTDEVGIEADGYSSSASAGDVDGDGDLDLFVAQVVDLSSCPDQCFLFPAACTPSSNLLFINQGGAFEEVAAERGLDDEAPSLVNVFFDADDDGDLDLYVGNDMGLFFDDRFYENDGSGRFTDRSSERGLTAPGTDTMGVDVGDYDLDGHTDLVITDFKEQPTRLFHCFDPNLPCSSEPLGAVSAEYVNWGVGFVDFDQDGSLDLFTTSGDVAPTDGEPNQLFWGDGKGGFELYEPSSTSDAMATALQSRGAAFADLDGDGDVDVAIANVGGPARVLLNESPKGHFVAVQVDSTSLGAKVTADVDGVTRSEHVIAGGSYLSSSESRVHFGLGAACSAQVTVRFPNGEARSLGTVKAGQTVTVTR